MKLKKMKNWSDGALERRSAGLLDGWMAGLLQQAAVPPIRFATPILQYSTTPF
jgi:hypothetical protein